MSSDDASDDDFPTFKLERSGLFAKTGLEAGRNYARCLMDRATGKDDSEARKKELDTRNARDLFKEFARLRGTALKLAQSMSMDAGLLPDEFMEVMAEAQYSVPPMNKALVRKRVRDGLGRFPELLFDEFEPEAMRRVARVGAPGAAGRWSAGGGKGAVPERTGDDRVGPVGGTDALSASG